MWFFFLKVRFLVKRSYLRCYDTSSIVTDYISAMRYRQWLCDVFVVGKIVEIMTLVLLQNILLPAGVFPVMKMPYSPGKVCHGVKIIAT